MRVSRTLLLLLGVVGLGLFIWWVEGNRLSTDEKAALARQAFEVPVDRLTVIGIRTPDYELDLLRRGDQWELAHPRGALASESVVRQFLSRLRNLNRGEIITPADMRTRELRLADFGLATPRMALRLETPEQSLLYDIGDPAPLGLQLYVKESSSQNVVLVSSDLLEILPASTLEFRDRTLVPFVLSDVRALSLLGEGNPPLRVEQAVDGWRLTEPRAALADAEAVETLLQKLIAARFAGERTTPAAEDLLAFASRSEKIRIWSATSRLPLEILVGGDVPGDPDLCFARISGQEGLVTVSKGMRALALTSPDQLRERRLFRFAPEEVREIQIRHPDQELRLLRGESGWELVAPVRAEASPSRILQMLRSWESARVEAFLPADPGMTVLSRVEFVRDKGAEGERQAFEVLGGEAPPGRALVRIPGGDEILQVAPDLVRFSPVSPLPYLSRQILQFDPETAVRLQLNLGGRQMTFARNGADRSWRDVDGLAGPEPVIGEILGLLSDLQADQLLEFHPADPGAYGLDPPELEISIGLGGAQPVNRTIRLRRPATGLPPRGMLLGQNLVFEFPLKGFDLVDLVHRALETAPAPPGSDETIRETD